MWLDENDKENSKIKERERQRKEKVQKLKDLTKKREEEKMKKEKKMTEDEEKQEKEKEKEEEQTDHTDQHEQTEEKVFTDYYCQYLHRITNTVEGVFYRKFDLNPPLNSNFTEPTTKLAVTFKTLRSTKTSENEFIKKTSKHNSSFINALTFVHLNIYNTNLMIRSLFTNIEMINSHTDDREHTLSNCFNYFSSTETLDERNQWFCPKCRQFVCAQKKLDIWKVPPILIIQLKRFYGSGYAARKIDSLIDFPEILDMKNYIVGPQKNENEVKYRLYAVSNQYGSLSGGHYTACARVRDPNDPDNDKGWYNFDDSSVSKSSESSAHTSAAYVLFYERINQ